MAKATWGKDIVEFGETNFKLGSRGLRFVVQFLDGLFFVLIASALTYLSDLLGWADQSVSAKAAFITIFLILIFFEDGIDGGRSLGKRLFGLRVLSTKTGKPCSLVQSFFRQIGVFIPFGSVFIFGARRQHLGDLMASTVVVVDRPSLFDEINFSVLGQVRRNIILFASLYLTAYAGYFFYDQHASRLTTFTREGISIEIPQSWDELSLNEEALIEVGSEFNEVYFVIFVEDHEECPLHEYAQAITDEWTGLVEDPRIDPITEISVGGHNAIQQQFHGNIDGTEVSFMLTTMIAGRLHFEIVAWTLTKNFNYYRDRLDAVSRSVKIERYSPNLYKGP